MTAVVAACSSDTVSKGSITQLVTAPAFGVAPFETGDTAFQVRVGTTHQLEATKTANGKAVPNPSVKWESSNPAVATVSATGLVTGVAQGTASIAASRGSHIVNIAAKVTCRVSALRVGATAGEITADDCLFPVAGRRSDYYSIISSAGEIIGISSVGLDGINGVKQETSDPISGVVYGSGSIGTRYRVIGNGDPLQFFISGRDSTKLGTYTVTRSIETSSHTCDRFTYVVPGTAFSGSLAPANSCSYNVKFSPIPEAIGKPLNTHRYWAKLEAKTYTVTLSGLQNSFSPALTIFPNILGARPVAQSIPGPLPALSSRSVTFTPSTAGYHLIEISSGRFVDNLVTWVVQSGSYSLSLTR